MSKAGQNGTSAKKKPVSKKKKQKTKIIILVVEILVLLILAVVAFAFMKLNRIEREEDRESFVEKIEINEDIKEESIKIMEGYTTIALFGLDNRSNGNLSKGNSDVIMIASINNDTHDVKLVSVYRDSYLDIGNNTFKKCNSAYAAGGPEQAINMLNKNLDLNITDYVTVDFNAIVECVDLIGGVEVTVTDEEAILMYGYMDEISKLTKKQSEYLPGAGTYNMDGVQATAFARIRYTTGDDYKRTERQRTVLTAMIKKAQKSDLLTINKLINEVFGDIKTSFSNTELISLAAKVFNYSLGDTTGFPFKKNTKTLGSKGDVVVPCSLESNVVDLHVFLYDDQDYEPTETVKRYSTQIIGDTGYKQGDGY